MKMSNTEWHQRFTVQARWTKDLRQYLYGRLDRVISPRVLEIGCGTGAILSELQGKYHGNIFGLDIDQDYLRLSQDNASSSHLIHGDANVLPFKKASFDITTCHFLLLWIAEPGNVIKEMIRVTRSGGWILAMAEPDYGGRIDYPEELAQIGVLQARALQERGADPKIGRKLSSLFHRAGLEFIETGILGAQWSKTPGREDFESEWAVINDDLHHIQGSKELTNTLKDIDFAAWNSGERILYVPTFYAIGKVPL